MFLPKTLIHRIAVIGFVTNYPLRYSLNEATFNGGFSQFYFVRRSALYVNGDRKARSVCNCHDIGALAALGIADKRPSFFCGYETAIDKAHANIDSTPLLKIPGKFCENLSKNALLDLLLEPTMVGLIWRAPWWQIFPRRACAQDPEDAVKNFLWFALRASAADISVFWGWN